MFRICWVKKEKCDSVGSRHPQAEAVLLRDGRHLPPEFFTRLRKRDQARESDGPLIPPIEEILKLQLGDRREDKRLSCGRACAGTEERRSRAVC